MTTLREHHIARTLDAVVKTGKPKTLRWKGASLRVTPSAPKSRKPVAPAKKKREARLTPEQLKRKRWLESPPDPKAHFILCDPEELVHMDWSVYWNPDPN